MKSNEDEEVMGDGDFGGLLLPCEVPAGKDKGNNGLIEVSQKEHVENDHWEIQKQQHQLGVLEGVSLDFVSFDSLGVQGFEDSLRENEDQVEVEQDGEEGMNEGEELGEGFELLALLKHQEAVEDEFGLGFDFREEGRVAEKSKGSEN